MGNNLYLAVLAYVAGLYCGLMNDTWMHWRWLFLAWSLVALLGMVLAKKMARVFFVALVLCFFSLGLWSGTGAEYPGKALAPLYYQSVTVRGSMDPLSVKHYDKGSSCVVQADSISCGEHRTKVSWKFRVSTTAILPDGGYVELRGRLLPLHALRNEGTFDMETWNRVNGFGGRIRKAEMSILPESGSVWRNVPDKFALWNLAMRQQIMSVLPNDRGALLCGMVLGGQNGISEETQEVFRANGLSHLLAVSGTHVLLLISFLSLLLKPLPNKYRLGILLFLLCAYACLCGLKPAVLRALCMSLPLILSVQKVERSNLFLLTAMLLLIIKPLWLLDVGFQMSFAAAGGILWFGRKISGYAHLYFPDFIAEIVTITGAAQLGVLPFLIAYFHQFSLLSFVSSLLLIPVLELGVVMGLAGYGVLLLSGWTLPLQWAGLVLAQALHWADLLSDIPGTMLMVAAMPIWCGVLYYLWLVFLLFLPVVHRISLSVRKAVLWLCFVGLAGTYGWCNFGPMPLSAYFLDVGQGDCAVVITPQRRAVVIDTGGTLGFDTGSRILVPFLHCKGINKVELLLLSHGDLDHAGGAAGLVRNMRVKKIILHSDNLSEFQENMVRLVDANVIEKAVSRSHYNVDGVEVKILDVPQTGINNTDSVVAEVVCNGYGMLFTGDMDSNKERELSWLRKYQIVKVPHHGSRYSNSEEFYEAVQPEVAVISVGCDNAYGHPHQEAVERINAVGAQVFRTDRDGMITVEFDEDGYCVKLL